MGIVDFDDNNGGVFTPGPGTFSFPTRTMAAAAGNGILSITPEVDVGSNAFGASCNVLLYVEGVNVVTYAIDCSDPNGFGGSNPQGLKSNGTFSYDARLIKRSLQVSMAIAVGGGQTTQCFDARLSFVERRLPGKFMGSGG